MVLFSFHSRSVAKLVSLIVTASMLAGCGKGPSAADAEAAVMQEVNAFLKLMGPPPGSRGASVPGIQSFKLGECREAAGRPGYVCTFSFEINGNRQSDEGRFYKIDSGWKYSKA